MLLSVGQKETPVSRCVSNLIVRAQIKIEMEIRNLGGNINSERQLSLTMQQDIITRTIRHRTEALTSTYADKVVTMATKRFVSVCDIRKDNDFFTSDNIPCCLSAVGYIDNNWSDKATVAKEALSVIAQRVATIYPNGRHVLFAHSGWLEDSRVSRYKKLWRRMSDEGVTLPDGARSNEVMRRRPHEILFSGFIEVNYIDYNVIPNLLLDHNNFFLMFCDLNEIDSIGKVFSESDAVDPRMGLLSQNDWLVEVLCSRKASIYRPYAWVDERYSGLVCIFNPEWLIYS
jgi:hypothetical protein